MSRVYCAVYGCLNSTLTKPEISYFKLPADAERRSKWLQLISRIELADKPPHHYCVCEEHFNPVDVLPGSQRKKLKKNSLPSLNLPEFTKGNAQTQTDPPMGIETGTQTEIMITFSTNASTQTSESSTSASSQTPRKRKLKSDILKCTKLIKTEETGDET